MPTVLLEDGRTAVVYCWPVQLCVGGAGKRGNHIARLRARFRECAGGIWAGIWERRQCTWSSRVVRSGARRAPIAFAGLIRIDHHRMQPCRLQHPWHNFPPIIPSRQQHKRREQSPLMILPNQSLLHARNSYRNVESSHPSVSSLCLSLVWSGFTAFPNLLLMHYVAYLISTILYWGLDMISPNSAMSSPWRASRGLIQRTSKRRSCWSISFMRSSWAVTICSLP